jgi:hypothetical protein
VRFIVFLLFDEMVASTLLAHPHGSSARGDGS